jgi:hypothetical protein
MGSEPRDKSGCKSIGRQGPMSNSGTSAVCVAMKPLLMRKRLSSAFVSESVAGLMDAQIAATLTAQGYRTARMPRPFTGKVVWSLREKWQIPTVKLNKNEHNPLQGEDGTYSVEGGSRPAGSRPWNHLRVAERRPTDRIPTSQRHAQDRST